MAENVSAALVVLGLVACFLNSGGMVKGLQHRVPLVDLIRDGLNLYFVPNGRTDDPEIPRVRSVVDYVARRLAIDWLPYEQRSELGIHTVDERMAEARAWMSAEDARLSQPDAFDRDLANGIGNPAVAAR